MIPAMAVSKPAAQTNSRAPHEASLRESDSAERPTVSDPKAASRQKQAARAPNCGGPAARQSQQTSPTRIAAARTTADALGQATKRNGQSHRCQIQNSARIEYSPNSLLDERLKQEESQCRSSKVEHSLTSAACSGLDFCLCHCWAAAARNRLHDVYFTRPTFVEGFSPWRRGIEALPQTDPYVLSLRQSLSRRTTELEHGDRFSNRPSHAPLDARRCPSCGRPP